MRAVPDEPQQGQSRQRLLFGGKELAASEGASLHDGRELHVGGPSSQPVAVQGGIGSAVQLLKRRLPLVGLPPSLPVRPCCHWLTVVAIGLHEQGAENCGNESGKESGQGNQ